MSSPLRLVLAAALVVAAAAANSSPSSTPASSPVNCVMTVYTWGECSKTCAGGTRSGSRTVTTYSSNGGSACPGLTKTEACNTGACAFPPPPSPMPPPLVATAYITVTANLTFAADVMGTDDAAAFKLKILPTIAAAARVDQSAVSLNVVVSSRRRARGLLAAAVNVDVNVTYGVDATPATRQLATDKAVAFMSKASYMTSMLLPAAMANTAHAGVTTLDAPAAVGLTCPPVKTYADASTLVGTKDYVDAKRVLNDLAICAHQSGTGLGAASMADNYNLLGFTNRKMEVPDVALSELYYKRALQIKPKHVAASGYLGELYVQTDKKDLAREVLDNLKTMCPPPAGCPSLDYLRDAMAKNGGYTEGALVRSLQWDTCFKEACSPTNVTVGDSIIFLYSSSHDVVKVATAAEYAACSSLTTTVVGGTSDGTKGHTQKFADVGAHYFVCGQGQHCKGGQKMVVHVFEPRKVASTGGNAPSYSATPSSGMATSAAAAPSSFDAILVGALAAAAVLVLA